MVNTRMITQELEYFDPTSLQEALHLLDRYGGDAKVIAGGTDLLVQMKLETVWPKVLISIKKIPELQIFVDGELPRIGAAILLRDVLGFCSGKKKYAALFEAIKNLGTVPIRNMGTLGGNLCNASPAADSAPPLLAFDARVKVCSLKGEKMLRLKEFFKDVNATGLTFKDIVTEIHIPQVSEASGSAFLKLTRLGAGISKVSAAAFLERDGDLCTKCRIALGSVAPVPMRAAQAEGLVIGRKIGPGLFEETGKKAAEEIKPVTDIRSTAQYRRRVAAFLVEETLKKAWRRAEMQ